ncbi:MAG: DeoR family transcriptional regulator [Patescibacteria group bacterium]|jgi:heat-inducible transcriptional repressor
METLHDRKKALFSNIIAEYVSTAHPVGSKVLVEKYGLDYSSATIRNDMKELEDLGLIFQPHTSAGRVPTETGYRYYIDNFIGEPGELSAQSRLDIDKIANVANNLEPEPFVKMLAKGVAELSDETVLVSFAPNNFYYTGLANMFRKPEFSNLETVCTMSELIDHIDVVMERITPQLTANQIEIFVGTDNPISSACSAIIASYHSAATKHSTGAIIILGPLRMQYQFNYQLLRYAQQLLTAN